MENIFSWKIYFHGKHIFMASVYEFSCDYMHTHTNKHWQRPIGCFKSQVFFSKRATNSRALLQKMTYKDKASYGSSPPFSRHVWITSKTCGSTNVEFLDLLIICGIFAYFDGELRNFRISRTMKPISVTRSRADDRNRFHLRSVR